jgi:hypothetical protein
MPECLFCKKNFSTKSNLTKHLHNCKSKDNFLLESQIQSLKEKYEKEIQSLKEKNNELNEKIEKLESQIFEIAKQPKTTNNNNQKINIINHLAVYDITQEKAINDIDENFSNEVFHGGPKAIAKLVRDKIITDPETGKPKLFLSDKSRLNAKYITETGEIEIDLGCEKTYNLIKDPLLDRNEKICIDLVDNQNEREIKRRIYDRFSINENSIKNKNQFLKKLFVNENLLEN